MLRHLGHDFRVIRIASLLVVFGAFMEGCGSEDLGFEVAPVTGLISQSGSPLANAFVEFWPVNGNRPSLAQTGPDGRYEMVYNPEVKGAAVGLHTVKIGTEGVLDPSDPEGRTDLPRKELLVVEAEVKPGVRNTLDFEVPVQGDKKSK